MESMILDKVDEKRKKNISIVANKLNALDLDKIIEQMENLIERFDSVFSIDQKQKLNKPKSNF